MGVVEGLRKMRCPNCNSDDVEEWSDISFAGDQYECQNCGWYWEEF